MGSNESVPIEKKITEVKDKSRKKEAAKVAEAVEKPKVESLEDLMKLCDEEGFKKNDRYKTVKKNIQKLIQVDGRARNIDKRKGEEFGQTIRDYITAVKQVTDSIPTPGSYWREQYARAGEFSGHYNKIMSGHAKDFEAFAGSLKLTVVTKQIIDNALSEAKSKVAGLDSEEKGEPKDLLEAVLTVTDALPKLIQGTVNYVEDINGLHQVKKDLERQVNKICESRIEVGSIEKLAADLTSYRKDFMLYCENHQSISDRVSRITEIAKTAKEAEVMSKVPFCLLDLEAAKTFPEILEKSKLNGLSQKISSAADGLVDVVSTEANNIIKKLTEPTKRWRKEFSQISNDQIYELRHNRQVKGELDKNNMSILFVSWSDVKREKGSCVGPNITDMQFFALPPLVLRPAAPGYLDLDKELFCSFPAVRSPNFTDEVDIRSADKYSFKVRDIEGEIKQVTMKHFLKHIGRYITDLEPEDDWGDAIDLENEKMQVASQFSVLPLLECADYKVDLGISAFGYQQKNLHIIIGPNGDIGWAPEGRGYKRIFFRDTAGILDSIAEALKDYFEGSKYLCSLICRFALGYDELRAIALVPEDREEVSKAFFKKPPKNESVVEEAKRYAKVENKLIHIQIEMERGEGGVGDFSQTKMFSCDNIRAMAKSLESKKNLLDMVKKTRADISKSLNEMVDSNKIDYNAVSHKDQHPVFRGMGMVTPECALMTDDMMMPFSFSSMMCSNSMIPMKACANRSAYANKSAYSAVPRRGPPDLGLLLARVQMGDSVGRANHTDTIPYGSKRTKGIAVRVTEMFYSVARNAEFTKPRVYRFMQQMSFAKRAGQLTHGSVVTGEVTLDK